MSHNLGETFEFEFGGRLLTGNVQRMWGPLSLILASDGEAYMEDRRKDTFRRLTDADRCPHCGGFVCGGDCPNTNHILKARMQNKKVISVSDLLAIEPGDKQNTVWVNDEFEAVVSDLKPSTGKGPNRVTLSMPSNPKVKLAGNFWGVDPSRWVGKLCRFGGQGIKRTAYANKFGKITQQVDLGEKAEITAIGESANAERPLPFDRASTPDNGRGASAGTESGNTGKPATDALRRARCYFGVLLRVEKAYQECRDKGLQTELAPADLKDVATHISMTYRGEYGSYAEPVFEKLEQPKTNGSYSPKALAEQPDEEWGGDGEPAELDWEAFIHPKRGIALGDMEIEDQLKYARWGAGFISNPGGEVSDFYDNVAVMRKKKSWDSPLRLLVDSLLNDARYGNEYMDNDIEAWAQSEHGSNLDGLSPDTLLGIIKGYEKSVASIIQFVQANKKAPKKGAATKADMPD